MEKILLKLNLFTTFSSLFRESLYFIGYLGALVLVVCWSGNVLSSFLLTTFIVEAAMCSLVFLLTTFIVKADPILAIVADLDRIWVLMCFFFRILDAWPLSEF